MHRPEEERCGGERMRRDKMLCLADSEYRFQEPEGKRRESGWKAVKRVFQWEKAFCGIMLLGKHAER